MIAGPNPIDRFIEDFGRRKYIHGLADLLSRRVVFGFAMEGWHVVFPFGSITLTEAGNLAVNYACDVTTVAEKLRNFFARPN